MVGGPSAGDPYADAGDAGLTAKLKIGATGGGSCAVSEMKSTLASSGRVLRAADRDGVTGGPKKSGV